MANAPVILVAKDSEVDTVLLQQAMTRLNSAARIVPVQDGEAAMAYLRGEGTYADRGTWPLPNAVVLNRDMRGLLDDSPHLVNAIRILVASGRAASKRILVVDDEPLVLETLQLLLNHLGHEVQTAHSAAEALRHLQEGEFDFVLTDVQMPDMDGKELAQRIKRSRPNLPVIFVSGNYGPAPTSALLTKPFSLDQLRQVLALNHPSGPPSQK